MHLYESNIPSGNAHKVHLILSHLGLTYNTTTLDITTSPSETRTPSFLALNPSGRIPILVLDDGTVLAESNAILFYLAPGTSYLPESKIAQAHILQWLFFEQNSHEPYIAVWKRLFYWDGFSSRSPAEIEMLKKRGQDALDVMEMGLDGKKWFVGDGYSIADMGLYVYTCSAEAVGFKVGINVKEWLKRVEGQKGFVGIKKDPYGKCPS